MWQACLTALHWLNSQLYRRRIEQALALNRRGEARSDGMRLCSSSTRLALQVWARDVHPWDRDRPEDQKRALFTEQMLADTEAAVARVFRALPHLDTMELQVLDPRSGVALVAGAVDRDRWKQRRSRLLSIRMRLTELGLRLQSAA